MGPLLGESSGGEHGTAGGYRTTRGVMLLGGSPWWFKLALLPSNLQTERKQARASIMHCAPAILLQQYLLNFHFVSCNLRYCVSKVAALVDPRTRGTLQGTRAADSSWG